MSSRSTPIMGNNTLGFSVLMSLYIKDNPKYLEEALASILCQTMQPSEIVLVFDGQISKECNNVIQNYNENNPGLFKIIALPVNKGLGHALGVGINHCSFDLVARMDSDDICDKTRFEKQVVFLNDRQDINAVGSNIEEFNENPGDLGKLRIMPKEGEPILKYAKYRNPMNHPSVMFRKSAVLDSGNYNGDIKLFEDYDLFTRMLLKGHKFYNIQQVLLHFRVGDGLQTIKRRSGWHYIKSEISFLKHAHHIGHINRLELAKSLLIKIPVRILPAPIVLRLYNSFLRKKNT